MTPALLISLLICAAPDAAEHGHRPMWPTVAEATVIETSSGLGPIPPYKLRYRVAFFRDLLEDHAKVFFLESRVLTFGGKPWPSEVSNPPLLTGSFDVDSNGALIGFDDGADEVSLLRDLLEAARGASDPSIEPSASVHGKRMLDVLRRAGEYRYAQWMSGALEAPRQAKERRKHSKLQPSEGTLGPVQLETWFEADPAAPRERLVIKQVSSREVAAGQHASVGPDRAGDGAQPAKESPASGGETPTDPVTVVTRSQTTFDRATLLPLRSEVVTQGGVGPGSLSNTLTYEFKWDDGTFERVQLDPRDPPSDDLEYPPNDDDAEGNRDPSVRSGLAPDFPSIALRYGAGGTALVRAEISTEGTVLQVELAATSGWGLLDLSAMDAVREARFHPQLTAGKAVTSWVVLPVNFALPDAFERKNRPDAPAATRAPSMDRTPAP